MPIPFADFGALPQHAQLQVLARQGVLLAELGRGAYRAKLYHLPGDFFCEVFVDIEHRLVLQVLPFTNAAHLEGYTATIGLQELTALPLIQAAPVPLVQPPAPAASPRAPWSLGGLFRALWARLRGGKRAHRSSAGSTSVEITRSGLPAAVRRLANAVALIKPEDPGKSS